MSSVQTITLCGKWFVILPEREFRALQARKNGTAARRTRARSAVGMSRGTRTTDQDRGDVTEAKRVMAAIRSGREKLIPWVQVQKNLGMG
jgi:hypothetical protein